MNAVSSPNASLTRPPSPAPTASIVPHRDPFSAFAAGRSSGSTTLGVAAENAGSNGAANVASTGSSTYASQIVSGPTSRNDTQTTARARSQAIISFRRSIRSASTPPIGEARKNADS